ncbi:hypothetical protein BJ138DRAFT_1017630 [Hygrophoropsis aurantiaca]|uniref:Uncharacterized protein n=1 Tax=Hygrophoropsis aurantiaca TaxID=72124 RepID=A0ACB7ZW88_9AGAM|nr:hypothetical protein BJ138DRAFT_1017630 [Hygrophoropsis aurantiaca]
MSASAQIVASFEDLFSVQDLAELNDTAETHPETKNDIYQYIRQRRDKIVGVFLRNNVEEFWEELTAAHGLISGSTALKLVLAEWTTGWTDAALDVYVPRNQKTSIIGFLALSEYHVIKRGPDVYESLEDHAINDIVHLEKNGQKIFIIESISDSAIAPVLRSHSTVAMNFFTAHACFCAYPKLSSSYRATINYGHLLQTHVGGRDKLVHHWKEYEERGYRYDEVSARTVASEWDVNVRIFEDGIYESKHTCKEDFDCPHTFRSTDDGGCLWMYLGGSADELKKEHGSPLTDVLFWLLGGKPCGRNCYRTLYPFTSIRNISLP